VGIQTARDARRLAGALALAFALAAGGCSTGAAPRADAPAAWPRSAADVAAGGGRLTLPKLARRGRAALGRSLLVDAPQLGLVTALASGGAPGAVLVTGTGGAVEVGIDGVARPVVGFARVGPAWPAPVRLRDELGFYDRVGAARRVALYDAAGVERWGAPEANAMAVGDLDGDGAVDFVVGLRGRLGVRRLDATGRVVWAREDADVRQVELVDVDGGGDLEIVHGNRQGAFVVRSGDGELLESFETGQPARSFAIAPWPLARPGPHILQREGDQIRLWTPAGRPAASLPAPVWNEQGRVLAAAFAPRRSPAVWLAVLDVFSIEGLSVLSVFDGDGRRVYDEVIDEPCSALGSLELPGEVGSDLLVGCSGRVWRYGRDGARVPEASVAARLEAGDAFGPLRFGDPPERVRALSALLPGHRCVAKDCASHRLRIGEREWMVAPQFGEHGLEQLVILGLPEPADQYGSEVRASWDVLVKHVSRRLGGPSGGARAFPRAEQVNASDASDGWRMLDTHRWNRGGSAIEVGVFTVDEDGPLQYAPYASFTAPARPAVAGAPPTPRR
jgi:hypothetical protein